MRQLFQTSIDQTGVAIMEMSDGTTKEFPLFSARPLSEAKQLMEDIPNIASIKDIFITGNLMAHKIEQDVEYYMKNFGIFPEDIMEEMVSGFPFVFTGSPYSISYLYA